MGDHEKGSGSIFCQVNVAAWCLAYGLVSGSLLVVNKWALHYYPVFLMLAFQMAASALVMYATLRYRGQVVVLNMDIMKKFAPVVFLFFMTLVTSSYSLQYLTVDILVALRCCSTFFVAAGEFVFGDRKLPSLISTFSLMSLAISSVFVFAVGAKSYFTLPSLLMGLSYVVALSVDQVINRMFVQKVELTTDERVLWMNALCFVGVSTCYVLSTFYHYVMGSVDTVLDPSNFFTAPALLPLVLSCLLGLGMSYTSWSLRTLLSALLFTVVGCVCKLLSLIINAMFLDHMDGISMFLVFLGVVSTVFFEETEVQKKKEYLVDLEKGGEGKEVESETDASLIFNRQRMMKLSGIIFLFFVICVTSIVQFRKTSVSAEPELEYNASE